MKMDIYQVIAPDVELGENVQIYSHVNLYGCKIGDNTKVGAFVEIQKGVEIGRNCKISSHSFICEGVKIGDGVFIGHHVIFINDKYPRATSSSGNLREEREWEMIPTLVEEGVSIGSGAVVMAGVTIGKNAMVGAGSLVLNSVPENTVVAGHPARKVNQIS